MILDGYWKKELIKLIKQLEKWQKRSRIFHDYSEHQVSKAVLYSAVIIRKIFEDEKGIEKDIEHLLHIELFQRITIHLKRKHS